MALASGSQYCGASGLPACKYASPSSPAAGPAAACKKRIACRSSLKLPSPASNKRALSNVLQVFCDEANGIVCYRAFETGEVTCEGFDEGPYFDPLLSPPSLISFRAIQDLGSSKKTLSPIEPKTQWDESLQMVVFEGFDEG